MTPAWAATACAALIGLTTTLVSPRWWIPALGRWGAVDHPSARSSHLLPAVRGLGLAPACGLVAGLASAAVLGYSTGGVVLVIALLYCGLGLVEDVRGLSVAARLGAQLGLGVLAGLTVRELDGAAWWSVPVVALLVAGYVDVANFMDGIDGMSGVHGVVCGAWFVWLSAVHGAGLLLPGCLVGVTFLGFLPWNLFRGRCFLGDCGSYLLGAAVAVLAVMTVAAGLPLLLAVAPALPYLADTVTTFVRRVLLKQRVWEAHRSHVYQRLAPSRRHHVPVAALVGAISVLCCLAAEVAGGGTLGWAACGVLILAYLASPRILHLTRSGVLA